MNDQLEILFEICHIFLISERVWVWNEFDSKLFHSVCALSISKHIP